MTNTCVCPIWCQVWDESHATTTLRTLIVVSNKVIWQMLSMETKIFLPFVTPWIQHSTCYIPREFSRFYKVQNKNGPCIQGFNKWNNSTFQCVKDAIKAFKNMRGHRGRDRMVVRFTTTYAISSYHQCCCEFESRTGRGVQHYVIKFVSDLRQVCGFLLVRLFPPPINLITTIKLKYCWKWH
jgi:hypothetical protein